MNKFSFVEVLLTIILAWILVDLYGKAINTFTYSFLSLNPENAWHAFVIAITATGILLAFIFTNKDISDRLEQSLSNMFGPPTPPSFPTA